MLYTGVNPNVDQAPPIEFYEPIEATTTKPPVEAKDIELHNSDVESLLSLLKYRMNILLQPLYIFTGMLASALGESNDTQFYKPHWKMPVRAYKKDMTIEKFFELHEHIPTEIMSGVVMTHYFNKKEIKEEEEENLNTIIFDQNRVILELEKENNVLRAQLDKLTPKVKPEIKTEPNIGLNVNTSVLSFKRKTTVYDVYQMVLSFSTVGGLEMATTDINLAAHKDFTTREMIESVDVRGNYAKYVAAKFATAQSHDRPQAAGRRYQRVFISPSFKQMTAQSKHNIGTKIWFGSVYRRTVPLESLTAAITDLRAKIQSIIDIMRNIMNQNNWEAFKLSTRGKNAILVQKQMREDLIRLRERARPQLYFRKNRRYNL